MFYHLPQIFSPSRVVFVGSRDHEDVDDEVNADNDQDGDEVELVGNRVVDKGLKLGLERVEIHSQGHLEGAQHEAEKQDSGSELATADVHPLLAPAMVARWQTFTKTQTLIKPYILCVLVGTCYIGLFRVGRHIHQIHLLLVGMCQFDQSF